MKKVDRRGKLWKATGKSMPLQGIVGKDGAVLSGDDAAEALAEHWGLSFAANPGDENTFMQFANYIQPAPTNIEWRRDRKAVEDMIQRVKKSSPGQMGFPIGSGNSSRSSELK